MKKNNIQIIVKCRWGTECSVSSAAGSWWSPGGVSSGEAPENFWLFCVWRVNEVVKIEETKYAKLFWIQVWCQSLFKCFKIKFHEDWFWKLSYNIEFFVPSIGHQIARINPWLFLPIFLGSSFYFPFCVFFICYWVFWIQCHHFYNHYLYKRHAFYDLPHFTVCKNKNHIKSWL